MKMPPPFWSGVFLTVGHFGASLLIVPLTLRIGGSLGNGPTDTFLYGLLALATKILYFPVLALALYPRHWFPGHLITIPIAVNSLLWGSALVLGMVIARRWRPRPRG